MRIFLNVLKRIFLVIVSIVSVLVLLILFIYSFNINYDKTLYNIRYNNSLEFYNKYIIHINDNTSIVSIHETKTGKLVNKIKMKPDYRFINSYNCAGRDYLMFRVASEKKPKKNNTAFVNDIGFAYVDMLNGESKEFNINKITGLQVSRFINLYTKDNKKFIIQISLSKKIRDRDILNDIYVFDSLNDKITKLIDSSKEKEDYQKKYVSNKIYFKPNYYIDSLNNGDFIVFNKDIGRLKVFDSNFNLKKEIDYHLDTNDVFLNKERNKLIIYINYISKCYSQSNTNTVYLRENIITKLLKDLAGFAYNINYYRSITYALSGDSDSDSDLNIKNNDIMVLNMEDLTPKVIHIKEFDKFDCICQNIYGDKLLFYYYNYFSDNKGNGEYPTLLLFDYETNKICRIQIPFGISSIYYGNNNILDNKLYYFAIDYKNNTYCVKVRKIK